MPISTSFKIKKSDVDKLLLYLFAGFMKAEYL